MSDFKFKYFSVQQSHSAMKVGTDAMVLGSLIDSKNKKNGLDIGAGTGVISLMVAQQNEEIIIDAVEIDSLSAEESRLNFQNSPWSNRLNVQCSNFIEFSKEKKYDLIFSNPPYHSATNLNTDKRKAQARHENSLPVKMFFQKVSDLISEKGELWIIIPFSEKEKWQNEAKLNVLKLKTEFLIKGKPSKDVNRIVLCFDRSSKSIFNESLVIRNEENDYSPEYIELTKDFHSKDLSK